MLKRIRWAGAARAAARGNRLSRTGRATPVIEVAESQFSLYADSPFQLKALPVRILTILMLRQAVPGGRQGLSLGGERPFAFSGFIVISAFTTKEEAARVLSSGNHRVARGPSAQHA
ncbi:MAG TPA: hypothetical protein VFO52_04115, partial [Longimicrobiales bacterium]|nr:hypothetical protein [Longimicrobiales bacterium]